MLSVFSIKNTNISFNGRYPNKVFNDVRDIPNLTCAKCGEKMISRFDFEKFLSSIRPSIKSCIKKLPELKQYTDFSFLQELCEKYPKENIDKILSHGKTEDNKQISISLINAIKRITFNAPLVIKKLQKYKKYMSESKLELLEIMEVYSKKYPDKTFEEIIKLQEVYDYHKQRLAMEKAILEQKAEKLFIKMENIAAKYGRETLEDLKTTNSEVLKIVTNRLPQDDSKQFIEQLYEQILLKVTDKKDEYVFKRLIQELPSARLTPDRIIVRLADRGSSNGIIYHFFSRTNTFEHIVPKSLNGENFSYNGICMCADCNEKRGTMPYEEEFQMFPEFGKNIQRQLSTIMRYILRGKLINYDKYPQEVKKTLYEESGNIFKLDIKNFLKEQIKRSQAEIETRKERLRKTDIKLKNIKDELSRLSQSYNALKSSQAKNNKKLKYEENLLQNYLQSLLNEKNF